MQKLSMVVKDHETSAAPAELVDTIKRRICVLTPMQRAATFYSVLARDAPGDRGWEHWETVLYWKLYSLLLDSSKQSHVATLARRKEAHRDNRFARKR